MATTTRCGCPRRTVADRRHHRGAGGDAVVDDDDDASSRIGGRDPERGPPGAQPFGFAVGDRLRRRSRHPQLAGQRVEHDVAVLVHRADGQLGLVRRPDLVHEHDVEVALERVGERPAHRHPAARHGEHERALVAVLGQGVAPVERRRRHDRERQPSRVPPGRFSLKRRQSRYSAPSKGTADAPWFALTALVFSLACSAPSAPPAPPTRAEAPRGRDCAVPRRHAGRPVAHLRPDHGLLADRRHLPARRRRRRRHARAATTTPPTTSSPRSTAARTSTRRSTSRAARQPVDQVPLDRLFGEAYVVDVTAQAAQDADYQVSVAGPAAGRSRAGPDSSDGDPAAAHRLLAALARRRALPGHRRPRRRRGAAAALSRAASRRGAVAGGQPAGEGGRHRHRQHRLRPVVAVRDRTARSTPATCRHSRT